MKKLLLLSLICFNVSAVLLAQSTPANPVITDTVKLTETDTTKAKKRRFNFHFGSKAASITGGAGIIPDTAHYASKAPGFSWGIIFSRFDLGLATLVDNGSFTLSPGNQFLSYRQWKTSNVGFDVIQTGYRFNSAFRIYLAAGFDWTLIRLRNDITILRNQPVLTYTADHVDYSKNRFSSSYLRIPLSFEFRSHDDSDGHPFHFVAGPDVGILLNGRVKQISAEKGKQKFDDDYHYTRLRYGAFARAGYGLVGVFAKYYFNDVFENSPAQEGLKNFSFGLSLFW